MDKLTDRQKAALKFMAATYDGLTCGYDLKVNGIGNLATLQSLSRKGYCAPVGLGHMAFPASADWKITSKGRVAAEQMDHAE